MTTDTDDLKELQELTKDNDETDVGGADHRTYSTPDPFEDEYGDCASSVEDEDGTLKENARQWAVVGDSFFPADPTIDRLKAGQYSIEYSNNRGLYFAPKPVNLDDLLVLPDSASEEIVNNIEHFWGRESTFRKLGFLWKRGVLLYGPAGSGKTSTLQLIIKNVIDRDGIAVFVKDPRQTAAGLEMLRRIEPIRPVIVLIEDIDALQQMHGEADLLAMLDGDLQIDNVVFIATTNYPEKLDKRLINRPSRFDIVRKIGMPTAEARAVYLNERNERIAGTDELNEWVAATDKFSIAHLKELIVSVEALGQGFDETIERLRIMIDTQPDSKDDEEKPGMGFLAGAEKKSAAVEVVAKPSTLTKS